MMRTKNRFILLGAILVSLIALRGNAFASGAADDHTALILDSTVSGGSGSLEAQKAIAHGLSVEVVNTTDWSAKSAADFATYRAIILGDATCTSIDAISAAIANNTTWLPQVNGNIVLAGTDPVFHYNYTRSDIQQVTDNFVAYAGNIPGKTGLYTSMSCYYHGTAPGTPVSLLDPLGTFTVTGVGCYNDAHIVASHPALAGLTDAILSGWSCSVHEGFDKFPSGFVPLVIAKDPVGGPPFPGSLNFGDGSSGVPYVLARGDTLIPVSCGNGIVEPGEECDDGNNVSGDGCSASCRLERCGNSVIDPGEQCDDGNTVNGDGCSATCQLERCGNGVVDPGERCDDGNTTNGDGCDNNCTVTGCGNGIVTAGEECDDGNTVSGDGCSSTCKIEVVSGCTSDADCSDGIFCNGAETCVSGACIAGNPVDCSPLDSQCTKGACNEDAKSCVATPSNEGGECNDNNACTNNDVCGNGSCVGTPINCDDGNACNGIESCNPELGCVPGTPLDCSSLDDVCGVGSCDLEQGCMYKTTVESQLCNDCNDGIDNDGDGNADCEDSDCSTLNDLCRFSIVGTDPTRLSVRINKDFTVGGSVCGDKARVSLGGVIENSLALNGDVFFSGGLPQSVIGEYFANNGNSVDIGVNEPLVGPDAKIFSDPTNTYVDLTGTNDVYTRCITAQGAVPVDGAVVAGLTATQSLGSVVLRGGSAQTVVLGSGQEVVDIDSLRMGSRTTLTLSGSPSTVVVLRVAGSFSIGGRSKIVLVGVDASRVLWYFAGSSRAVRLGSRVDLSGTMLAPDRPRVKLSGFSVVHGAVYGKQDRLSRSVVVDFIPFNAVLVP